MILVAIYDILRLPHRTEEIYEKLVSKIGGDESEKLKEIVLDEDGGLTEPVRNRILEQVCTSSRVIFTSRSTC